MNRSGVSLSKSGLGDEACDSVVDSKRGTAGDAWTIGLVSIIMPAHNSEKFLGEAVASVQAQTFQDWELIIVDDASTDDTLLVASQFAKDDARIHAIHLETNWGAANARNVAIDAARGQFLAFLDSDDQWLSKKLEIQIDYMKRQGVGFSFTQYRRFDASGHVGKVLEVPQRVEYHHLLRGNVIGCLTVVVDRSKVGDFRMSEVWYDDYIAWLSILRQGHIAHGIQVDLARYRLSHGSISANKLRSAFWTWKIYREVEKLSAPMAVWCFMHYCLRSVSTRLGGSWPRRMAR